MLVFRETPDNRGRPKGDVMRLLTEGAAAAGCAPDRIHALHEEMDAARRSLDLAGPGDVVVLMPTRVEAVWQVIQNHQPRHKGRSPDTGPVLEPAHG